MFFDKLFVLISFLLSLSAARAVLAHNGVEVKVVYPQCCGMPQLEQGNIANVASKARNIAKTLNKYIDEGFDIVSLIPSCSLMIKHEWQSLLPEDQEIKKLSSHTFDISEYVIDIAKREGLVPGLKPLQHEELEHSGVEEVEADTKTSVVSLHNACHSRAQNIGFKAEEMLKFIPSLKISVVESCSGHGGSWGVKKETFPIALKVGKRTFRETWKNIEENDHQEEEDEEASKEKILQRFVSSECPLAGEHLKQGMEEMKPEKARLVPKSKHPIELFAASYGLA